MDSDANTMRSYHLSFRIMCGGTLKANRQVNPAHLEAPATIATSRIFTVQGMWSRTCVVQVAFFFPTLLLPDMNYSQNPPSTYVLVIGQDSPFFGPGNTRRNPFKASARRVCHFPLRCLSVISSDERASILRFLLRPSPPSNWATYLLNFHKSASGSHQSPSLRPSILVSSSGERTLLLPRSLTLHSLPRSRPLTASTRSFLSIGGRHAQESNSIFTMRFHLLPGLIAFAGGLGVQSVHAAGLAIVAVQPSAVGESFLSPDSLVHICEYLPGCDCVGPHQDGCLHPRATSNAPILQF